MITTRWDSIGSISERSFFFRVFSEKLLTSIFLSVIAAIITYFTIESNESITANLKFSRTVLLSPFIETIVFQLFIMYGLYVFDVDRKKTIAIASFIFAAGHISDGLLFYVPHLASGYYLARCFDFFAFERSRIGKAIIYTFILHAFWNGLIYSISTLTS